MSQSCYYLKWHSAGHNDCKNEPKQHNAPVKTASCQKIWKSVCFHDNCQIYLYAFSYRFSCFMAGTTWYQKALLGSNKGWNSQHSASKHHLAKMTKSYDKEFDEKQELVSTSKNYLLMAMIAVVCIVWGANTSLPAPFYPKMAEEKGATPSQVIRFSTKYSEHLKDHNKLFITDHCSMGLCLVSCHWQPSLPPHALGDMVTALGLRKSITAGHSFRE